MFAVNVVFRSVLALCALFLSGFILAQGPDADLNSGVEALSAEEMPPAIEQPQVANKPVLVLFPIEINLSDDQYEDEFGSALQQGLQTRFDVFYGPDVEAELKKEYQKLDCDAERCSQNLAIAFNGELVGDASATRIGEGYALKLVIRNVITGAVVETRSEACRQCDPFNVIDAFKQIGRGEKLETAPKIVKANEALQIGRPATLIFDSQPSAADVWINGAHVGVTPYKNFEHYLGERIELRLSKANYQAREQSFVVREGLMNLETFPLMRETGSVRVIAYPTNAFYDGAQVLLNAKALEAAETSAEGALFQVPFGKHQIELKTKHASYHAQIAVIAGEEISVELGRFSKLNPKGEPLANDAKTWACVLDQHSGLMWEVKTLEAKMHFYKWQYSWYEPLNESNGGFKGVKSLPDDMCHAKQRCDTHSLRADVNKGAGLCAFNDWRLPAKNELDGLFTAMSSSDVDAVSLFPFMHMQNKVWAATSYKNAQFKAWFSQYSKNGVISAAGGKGQKNAVRLVRGAAQ